MIVQIYEIQTPQEAQKCIELGVDHLGSVLLSQEDWRLTDLKDAMLLSEGTDTKNSLIPLFRNRDILYRALDFYNPDYVHFCDSLTDHDGISLDLDSHVRLQSDLKKKFPEIGIIRSIPVPKRGESFGFPSLMIAHTLEPVSDFFLTDTYLGKEPVKGFIGITGKTGDWDVSRELVVQSKIPVILGGGLSPGNVYRAIMEVAPAGVDSCTLTNRRDRQGKAVRFKKDFHKVEKFVREVRKAEIPTALNELED